MPSFVNGRLERSAIKTAKYKATLPEDIEQQMVFEWAAQMEYRYPCLRLMYHVPNEGKRTHATAAKMKRIGLKKGVLDICLPVARGGFHGCYIEMKAVGGRATPEQREYLDALRSEGYFAALCVGHEAAQDTILGYINGAYKREVSR